MNSVSLVNFDLIPYAQALALQHRVVAAVKRGAMNDTLLLLEHPPVFTLGRNANDSNVLASSEFLEQQGIEIYRVERGGDVTYHGPRQLVGYPILNLRHFRQDVGWFVRSLEELLIRALGDFGIQGRRVEKLIGVWVDSSLLSAIPPSPPTPPSKGGEGGMSDAKIAQIGARIEDWVTYHGMALNVDPDMRHFDLIVPCGISDKAVTSMARLLQRPIDVREVRRSVAARFAEVFDVDLVDISPEELEARLAAVE